MKFKDSILAHTLLDGKQGVEIGGSAHNSFNIPNCKNIDFTDDLTTIFKEEERRLCGEMLKVDYIAPAWALPFPDASLDFILSSHVLEHCWDVIGTIEEWFRVLRPHGLIFAIIPHKERTFDKDRPRTTLAELHKRRGTQLSPNECREHFSVWIAEDWLELCKDQGWHIIAHQDPDDKVGNGFTIVLEKV